MKKKRVSPGPAARPSKSAANTKSITATEADLAGFSFGAVRELARIAVEFDLVGVEAEPGGLIRITRRATDESHGVATGPVRSIGSAPHLTLAPPPAPEPAVDSIFVTSPFVGTFYRAASPEAPPFADVGQSVHKGQAVCIIEAMKLMNEIESEADGKVVEILAKNGDHVEYGQPLFRLQKA